MITTINEFLVLILYFGIVKHFLLVFN